jgi:protocatechuate 3,4-dioxygenase beta subunit
MRATFLGRRELLALLAGAVALGRWRPAAGATTCVLRPEQTEGPFFVDDVLARSDIRTDPGDGAARPGTPLSLTLSIARLAAAACTPYAGVLVDLWHCDAAGDYSGVGPLAGRAFLRGVQTTDRDGRVRFTTIYPGWYPGRAVHVHVKLRVPSAGVEYTSQLYFDDAVTDTVFAAAPYAARGTRSTRNADDGIFAGGGTSLTLAATPDGSGGYAAAFDFALQSATCATTATCLTALSSTLPAASDATSRPTKRTARRLESRLDGVARAIERAEAQGGQRRWTRVTARLERLLASSRSADRRGRLTVSLAAVEAAAAALRGVLPAG